MGTVEHPRVRPGTLDDRLDQAAIAEAAVDHNTLVVLPTGLGKTAVALRVVAEHLLRRPSDSVLFLAPTRPLVVQHAREVARTLFAPEPLTLTGAIPPDRRAALLHPPQVVVATPQVVANDLADGGFPMNTFSLIVFDEAHRAVGDYPYVTIGRANREGPNARILAMTASPGGSLARIREVWANLGIERFEDRTEQSPDVLPYVHGIGVEAITVPVPAGGAASGHPLADGGPAAGRGAAQARPRAGRRGEPPNAARRGGPAPSSDRSRAEPGRVVPGGILWKAVTAQAAAMKGLHALELIESQGVDSLREYFRRQVPAEGKRWTRPPGRFSATRT